MSPGRQEQVAAEHAALVNALRMKMPLVVIAWPDSERTESFLGVGRARLAQRPFTMTLGWMLVAFGLGVAFGGFLQ